MRAALKIAGTLFAIGLTACGAAQTTAPATPGKLELRLQPGSVDKKIPQAFTVQLVNGTDHDVRVPTPSLDCGDVPHGTVWLRLAFKPFTPGAARLDHGCATDFIYSPVSDVIKSWKVLRPGESVTLVTINDRVLAHEAGSYDYWVHYEPPGMPEADQEWLRTAGIDYPKGELDSAHVKFVKR